MNSNSIKYTMNAVTRGERDFLILYLLEESMTWATTIALAVLMGRSRIVKEYTKSEPACCSPDQTNS